MTPTSADVLASDGGVVHLRAIVAADRVRLLDFYRRLPTHDVYTRFFSHRLPAEELLTRPAEQRSTDFTLGAFAADELIGVGGYIWEEARAGGEVAFAVASEHQHRGIGTLLLEHLATHAREHDLDRFHAYTLPQNRHMIDMFLRAGYIVDTESDGTSVLVSFVLDDAADDEIEARDQRASAHSMERLLQPKSVAVFGALNDPTSAGHALVRSLTQGNFQGSVFPISSSSDIGLVGVAGGYPTLASVPSPIDLALIDVPAAEVRGAVEACGRAGVHAAVVITAGFADVDDAGAVAQNDLLDLARYYGMRLVGPNSVGIANTDPVVRLDATISPVPMVRTVDNQRHAVSIASQSGALGVALIDALSRAQVTIGSFVSLGNKADVSGNDLLQYWQTDPGTDLGVLYLESFGNPRRFARIAARVSETKPLIVAIGGESVRGNRAADVHPPLGFETRSLLIPFLERSGIITVDTLTELVDVTRLLASQPVPTGDRIAIVSNSQGFATITADACESAGLTGPTLSPETLDRLLHLEPTATDVNAGQRGIVESTSPAHFAAALSAVLDDPNVDGAIAIHADLLDHDAADIALAIDRAAEHHRDKPVAAVVLDPGRTNGFAPPPSRSVPIFDFPEQATTALGHAAQLNRWRNSTTRTPRRPDGIDIQRVRSLITEALVTEAHPPAEPWEVGPERTNTLLAASGVDHVAPPDSYNTDASDLDTVVLNAKVDDVFGVVLSVGRQFAGNDGTAQIEPCGEVLAPLGPLAAADLIGALHLSSGHQYAISGLAERVGHVVNDVHAITELELTLALAPMSVTTVAGARCVVDRLRHRGAPPRRLGRGSRS